MKKYPNIKSICLFILSGFFLLIQCNTPADIDNKTPVSSDTELQKNLLQGWNTWNNPNLLSHVLMPDGLSLRITFRKKRGGPYWLDQAYISGPKINFPDKVTPIAHAYDGGYTSLILKWEGLETKIESAHDGNDIVILYEPLKLPSNPPVMLLEAGMLWNRPGTLQKYGDKVIYRNDSKMFVIRATNKDRGYLFPLATPYLSFESDTICAFYTGKERSIEEIRNILKREKDRFEQEKNRFEKLAGAYEAMQAVNAWNVIYDAQNNRAIVPVSRVWNETWGGYILFDWDTYFTALMLAIDSKELAYSNAIAITNAITERGFIPNLESSFGNKSFDRSQPPVGSMCCKLLYDKFQEKWFLEAVYDNLLTWNRWWIKARNNEGFLSWGSDPHPRGMDGHTKQGAKWESGLDNSPLFDEAVFNKDKNVLELADVGLMGLYVADCKYLAEIADVLGKPDDKIELMDRADQITSKLQELWDEESGIYRDKYTDSGLNSMHLAPTNFYPLIGGVPTHEQAERMINEHFLNPDEFYGDWMIPSIARNDPAYADNSYWRGRIWAPMNFLVYMGFRQYDLPEARKTLVEKSLKLIMKEWNDSRSVFENYNSMTGVGADVRNANNFYSWGGLLGFIALMEEGYF
jgi:hypothetical protein